jgi:hypothetical protein
MRFGWLIAALLLFLPAGAQTGIRLKSGVVDLRSRPSRLGRHYVLYFSSYPDATVREELARRSVRILEFLPDSGLMVSSDGPPVLGGLDVAWAGSLTAADKLSPQLDRNGFGAYLVLFHEDVPARAAAPLLRRWGFQVLDRPGLLPGHFLVMGTAEDLAGLASQDEVSYILPASPELLDGEPVMACAGAVTEAGIIGQYVEMGHGWAKDANGITTLQYAIQSVTPNIPPSAVHSEIARALVEWSRAANVVFTPGSNPSGSRTISIQFAQRAHGDPYPFDGPGGVLAHTFYPAPLNPEPIAGDMHLDADETWRVGANIDLFSVALHEAGHALGLGHSDKPGAVMYPYYHIVTGLSGDDIAGIRDLYGAAATTPAAPPQTPAQPPVPPTAPAPADRTPPSLRIVSPGSSVVASYSPSLVVSGTAADDMGVAVVRWSTSTGGAGTASGTNTWSANVPLLIGNNTITIRAYDAAANSSWRAITVVRR